MAIAGTDLADLSATELVAGYRAGDFSPVEAVEAVGRRIEAENPRLGAFTTLCLDRALDEARTAKPGSAPLAGVPFAAKDLFDTAGVRTTRGSPLFADHVPDTDAAAVAALRAAGAILVGKTQTHEFAWGITSINVAMGSARNPWSPDRVTGGSSGGSGAALAARLVPLATGSDTGGSIRIPSAFCGVLGLKPTFGRLDIGGVWPLAPSLDHVGPMARTPDDLELMFAVLDGRPAPAPVAAELATLAGVTVVTCPDLCGAAMPPDLERVQRDALATLERLGARVEERPLPAAGRIFDSFRVIQMCEAARVHADAGLYPARQGDYGADVRTLLERANAIDPRDYVEATAEREAIRADLGRLVAGDALLLTPVAADPPAPIEALQSDRKRAQDFRQAVLPFTTPQDLAGLPAAAVRAGFDDRGLPVAIQITGAAWRDDAVLAAARAFHQATPGVQSRWPQPSSS